MSAFNKMKPQRGEEDFDDDHSHADDITFYL
jgi:hypothetical protein